MLALLQAVLKNAARHEVMGRAAQISFYALLAMFPAVLVALGLLAMFGIGEGALSVESLSGLGLPRQSAALIVEEISGLNQRTGWALAVAVVITLYYGSRALGAAVRGVELAFSRRLSHVTTLRSGLLGLGITGVLLFMLPLVLMVLTVGSGLLVLAGLPADAELYLLRWSVLCLVFQQAGMALYRLGARESTLRWFSWGSVGASIAWAAVTLVVEWFLNAFTDLGATYGSLGAIIGLLLYVNVVAYLILLGAELDAARLHQTGGA